jgi:prefoldin subunit 5
LTNGLWIEAEVPKSEKVYLWLGVLLKPKHFLTKQANVMVEYSFEEAIQLLSNNLEQGKKSLEKAESDMTYMKDQITVTEVSILPSHTQSVAFFP